MFSRTSGDWTSFVLKYLQSVFFVMSSFVGPMPPVTSTTSARFIAESNAWMMSFSRSRTDVFHITLKPISLSCWAIHAELVSITCPISSSSPIVIISTFIVLFC